MKNAIRQPADKNQKYQKGFSLVEAAVVFAIGSTVVVSLINLIFTSLASVSTLRDHVTAMQLAQEGMEIVYNLRTNSFLETLEGRKNCPACPPDQPFDFYLRNCEGNSCCVDAETKGSAKACPNDNQRKLFLNSDGLYVHDSSGAPTRFSRWVTVAPETVPGETELQNRIRVDVFVRWDRGETHLSEYLYNWLWTP